MAKLRKIKRSPSYQLKRDAAATEIKKRRAGGSMRLATGKEGKQRVSMGGGTLKMKKRDVDTMNRKFDRSHTKHTSGVKAKEPSESTERYFKRKGPTDAYGYPSRKTRKYRK